jgi:MFS family permease
VASVQTRILICSLLLIGSLCAFLATDLVLPAIPELPAVLGGGTEEGQFVLASFLGGAALGLLVFGAISWRFNRKTLLMFAISAFGVVSFACTLVPSIWPLIGLRFLQGFFCMVPAVIGPGIIRQLFSEKGATRAIGLLASLEALAPALGPIAGAGLLLIGDWKLSFWILAGMSFSLALALAVLPGWVHRTERSEPRGSYISLLRSRVFLRYAGSQAFCVGGLIMFVMCARVMLEEGMGGDLSDFIIMQVCGVTTFILATNTVGWLVARFGAERIISFGTWVSTISILGMLIYALTGQAEPLGVCLLFIPFNAGLGFRGPPGFLRAVISADGQDDRGSSLVVLAIFLVASGGTALLAPFVEQGLVAVAACAFVIEVLALVMLYVLPKLEFDQLSP